MYKSILISFILFLAATFVAAQSAFTPYEGTQKTYKVSIHAGSSYQWNVYSQLNPLLGASSSAFIITNNGSPQISILWVKTGQYYLLVTETDASGCSNTKAARVEVLPNNIALFTQTTSSACYQSINDFSIPIQFSDGNGQSLSATRFPINVSFLINGTTQATQVVSYGNQNLAISGSSFAASTNQDTPVVIQITGATDSQNQTLQPDTKSGQNIHTRTIYAKPQIQFVESGTTSLLQGDQHSFSVTGSSGNIYHYVLLLPDGSTQTITSTTSQSGSITFAQIGIYTLRVQATDTKGCLSEWIAKTINVENNIPLEAIADAATTQMETPVTINILANDLGVTSTAQAIVPPKSVQGAALVRNTNGSVTYEPVSGFWGIDSFTYQLCATGQTTGCSTATVTVDVKNPTIKDTGILAVTDINNTWAGTTVSGNVLTNDLFFDAALVEAKIVTIPLAESGKLTHFDKKTGDYTFVPADGYTGEAIFEYQICQQDETGKTVCSISNVSIKVLSLSLNNQTPVANNDVVLTTYNTAIRGNFLRNDFIPGSGNMSISQVRSSGLAGTLKWDANGDFSYIPLNGFTGEEHFTYQICNGAAKCDWGTVSIYVMSPNLLQNGLYANYDAYFTEGLLTGNLSGNDLNNSGAGLVYKGTPLTGPAHGTVQLKPDGNFTYIPQKGVVGQITDQFVVEACTSATPQQCSKETVYIVGNVSKINLLANSEITTGACLPVVLDASASTGVGALTYHWSPETYLSDPANSKPLFTPGKSTDYILTVTDQAGNTASKTVHVKVDVAPQINTATQVFVQSPSEVIMLDASASVGNSLKFNWSATQGGLIVSGAQTDKPQIKGVGKYYLKLTDQYGCTDLDSIVVGLYIHVKAVNDTSETKLNLAVDINVLANDIPKSSLNPTTLKIVTPPQNGMATVVGDSLVSYLPNSYFVGSDSFIYSICDYLQHCDQATVLVLVNDLPFFIPEAFSPNGDGVNDEFVINGLAKYKSVEITIFNRWGNTVYHSNNYGEGQGKGGFWNGTASQGLRFGSGPVPTGTYFYILKLDGKEKINGAIYLDR